MLSPARTQNLPPVNQSEPGTHSDILVADFMTNPCALLALYPLAGG